MKGNFYCTSTSDDGVGFENSLNDAERIVNGSLNFIQEEFVGTSQHNGLSSGFSHSLEEHVLPVTDSLFIDLLAISKVFRVERFFTLDISKGNDNPSSGVVSNSPEVRFLNSSDGYDSSFNEVLESKVINTSCTENNIGA